jgi:hypothetical protein
MTRTLTREKVLEVLRDARRDKKFYPERLLPQLHPAEIEGLCYLALCGLKARERCEQLERMLAESHAETVQVQDDLGRLLHAAEEIGRGAMALEGSPRKLPGQADTDPGREERDKLDRLMELEMRLYDIEPEPPSPVAPASELVIQLNGMAVSLIYGSPAWLTITKAAAALTSKDELIAGLRKEMKRLRYYRNRAASDQHSAQLSLKAHQENWNAEKADLQEWIKAAERNIKHRGEQLAEKDERIAELEKALRKIVERHEFGGEHLNIARAALSPEAKEK